MNGDGHDDGDASGAPADGHDTGTVCAAVASGGGCGVFAMEVMVLFMVERVSWW